MFDRIVQDIPSLSSQSEHPKNTHWFGIYANSGYSSPVRCNYRISYQRSTVEPRYNEVPRDWENVFVISGFHCILVDLDMMAMDILALEGLDCSVLLDGVSLMFGLPLVLLKRQTCMILL